jgi:hypothetical protein
VWRGRACVSLALHYCDKRPAIIAAERFILAHSFGGSSRVRWAAAFGVRPRILVGLGGAETGGRGPDAPRAAGPPFGLAKHAQDKAGGPGSGVPPRSPSSHRADQLRGGLCGLTGPFRRLPSMVLSEAREASVLEVTYTWPPRPRSQKKVPVINAHARHRRLFLNQGKGQRGGGGRGGKRIRYGGLPLAVVAPPSLSIGCRQCARAEHALLRPAAWGWRRGAANGRVWGRGQGTGPPDAGELVNRSRTRAGRRRSVVRAEAARR